MKNNIYLKNFLKYTSLNVMGMIGISVYILADTFFVAQGAGENGLTALNIAIPLYSIMNGTGLMIGVGASTKYSIFRGRADARSANEIFGRAIFLGIFFSVIYICLSQLFMDQTIKFLGANADVFDMSKEYSLVITLFAPMFVLNNILMCFVRNDGNPQLAMTAMIIGSLSNVVLDYIFVFPLNMGIFGAALATAISPIISIFVMLTLFIRRKNNFKLVKTSLNIRSLGQILLSGLPALITELSTGAIILVFNIITFRIQGNTGIAAYGVIANISIVVLAIYTGIAQGIQPIISSSYGAGNAAGIKYTLKYAFIAVSIVSAIIYAGIFFSAEYMTAVFNAENNETLQSIAVSGLRFYFIGCLMAGINIISSMYFTSIEQNFKAQTISILRGFVLIIPMAFILSSIAGLTGVWLAFPFAELIVTILALILLLSKPLKIITA